MARPTAPAESPFCRTAFFSFGKPKLLLWCLLSTLYRCITMNPPSATRDENALGLRPNALDPSRRDLAESGPVAPEVRPKGGRRGEKIWK